MKHKIIQGKGIEEMQKMPSHSIDCIITDPPYWTLDKWRNVGTTTRLGGHRDKEKQTGWFGTIDQDDLVSLIDESSRVLAKQGHCWMMCDGQTMPFVTGYIVHGDGHDFEYFKSYPVIKRAASPVSRAGSHRQSR